jgi:putative ABC transport system substrate-binding protein
MQFNQLERRAFITLLGGAAATWPLAARAQPAGVPRIGFLGNSTPELEANLITPFRNGLRALGYEEGRNIVIEFRWAEGRYERFPALIAELIAAKVAIIVTAGTPATLAVKNATTSIPLVMIAVGDPISTGIVPSLKHPGGNITGLTSIAPELEAKRLELLREVFPRLSHIALLWNPSNAYQVFSENEVRALALVLGLKMLSLRARNRDEIEQAFASVIRERPDALLVLADRLILHNGVRAGAAPARGACLSRACRGGRADVVWSELRRPAPARSHLRGQDFEGNQTGRPAGRGAGQVRPHGQPQDRQGARPHSVADAAGPRRRGH